MEPCGTPPERFLHIGHDRRDVLVGDQRQGKSADGVDEKEEDLVVLHDVLEGLRAVIVKVRGGLVDAAQLRDVEAVEDLVSADRFERLASVRTVPGSLDSSTTVVPLGRSTLNRWIGRSNPGPWMRLPGKPFGGGFETTMLIDTGFVEPSNGGKMRFSRFCTCAGPPWHRPQKLSNFSLPTPFELRQRRVEVGKRTAGVDRRRELPDLRRREDVPLEFGDALQELHRGRHRRLHVLVDRAERLRFERRGRTILLIRRGVLQHVQRGHRPRERHVRRRRIVGQPYARRQRHPNLDERPRPQEREVVFGVVRVDRAEERIGRAGVVPSRTLEPLPSRFDRGG